MNEKKILIKCFNELHYNIHLNEIRDVVTSNILVLLLPYLQSMRRQLRFLKTLKKGNIEYICFGYNYCFISLLKFVFKGSLESQVLFEFSPFEKRSNDFSPFKGKAFVSDDFEINSFLFNRNLIFNGINVVNRCHGIGKYSPHVSYNISYFYNKTQEAFYLKYNVLNSKIFKYKEKKINKYLPITYLFISQSKSNMDPLFELENEILNKMKSILAENAPNLYVKLHPDFNGKFNFPILDNLNDFNGLIFTFYSTCYYTFKRYGPTFLIKINNIKSNLIFGDDSRYIKITELNNYEEFLEFA